MLFDELYFNEALSVRYMNQNGRWTLLSKASIFYATKFPIEPMRIVALSIIDTHHDTVITLINISLKQQPITTVLFPSYRFLPISRWTPRCYPHCTLSHRHIAVRSSWRKSPGSVTPSSTCRTCSG